MTLAFFSTLVLASAALNSAPDAWIGTDDPAKDPREVRLIMHPAIEGDL